MSHEGEKSKVLFRTPFLLTAEERSEAIAGTTYPEFFCLMIQERMISLLIPD